MGIAERADKHSPAAAETMDPIDHQPRSVAFHDRIAAQWDRKYASRSFRRRQAAFEKCLPAELLQGKWLDAGCGTGPLARWLVQEKPVVIQPIDLSPRMVDILRHHRELHPNKDRLLEPIVADVNQLPFPAESFRGVLCSSVLEYVEDPRVMLTEFYRVLAPGGWLSISVPNRTSLLRRGLEAAFHLSKLMGHPWPAYMEFSVHHFTVREFQELLQTTGFEPHCFAGCGSSLPGLEDTRFGWSLSVFGAIKKA